MEELQQIQGKIVYEVFHNKETLFTVLRIQLNTLDEKVICGVGLLEGYEEDKLYNFFGNYREDPKYGMQFKITYFEAVMPSDKESIIRYLSGPDFKGIGKKMASVIVERFGEECLDMIKKDPEILNDIPKMTYDKKQVIVEGINKDDDVTARSIQFFLKHGLSIRNIIRLNTIYGKDAVSKMTQNPYRVIREVDGFGFKTADKIAMSMGYEKDDPLRVGAYLVSLTMDLCMQSGDTFVLEDVLKNAFYKSFDEDVDFYHYLSVAIFDRSLVQVESRVYPVSQYDAEFNIANYLTFFPYEEMDPYDEEVYEWALNDIQEKLNIVYDEKQMEAIRCFIENDMMILTGGPGTGKTTVIRGMVSIFKQLYPSYQIMCAAPTGRAAKRLSELTDNEAVTLHSLLAWDLETNTFGKNEDEPLLIDLLIIDEFSMVDSYLFYNLVKAGKKIKKICIIGDENQLPSVGPGCVLKDLIESGICPLIRLEHIFRQKEGSDVIALAHDITLGQVDLEGFHQDFSFIECNPYQIKDSVIKVVSAAIEKGYDLSQIQVMAPLYNGPAGIDRLNNALQECFNPSSPYKRELKVGYRIYRIDDKILQLKNQPDDDVYNGDIGVLVDIVYPAEDDNHQARLLVDFDGILVEYTSENFSNISHAYCISVHKSQGSEYPIVIMPLTHQYHMMLQRRLIYTGITRAKKSLVLIGEKSAFYRGIENFDARIRNTTLTQEILARRKTFDFDDEF